MSKSEDLAQKYTRKQAWEKLATLPQKVQDVILAPENLENIYLIAKDNNILNKAQDLVRYVDLVLLGIVPITLLRETLEEELQIDEERARKVAMEIRDKIFMQVKDELREIHGLK